MNFQRGKRHEDLEMNLVPLIDVLLVIIIFLVVSATFSRVSELQINLPTAEANPQQDKPLIITVDIDASGHYAVNSAAISDPNVATIGVALRRAVPDGKDGEDKGEDGIHACTDGEPLPPVQPPLVADDRAHGGRAEDLCGQKRVSAGRVPGHEGARHA